jgi:hypothetical protein
MHAQKATATATKMNVFYIGVQNPLTIVVENHDCSEVVVKTSNGTITGSECNYSFLSYDTISNYTYLYIGVQKDSIVNWVDTIYFRFKRLPAPIATLSNPKLNDFDTDLYSQRGIIPITPKFDFDGDVYFIVTNYSFKISRNDSIIFKVSGIAGNHMLPKNETYLKNNCKNGDVVLIYDILAVGPDGIRRKLNEIKQVVE